MTGNLPQFEEAWRALYAGEAVKLEAMMQECPRDMRDYVKRLLKG